MGGNRQGEDMGVYGYVDIEMNHRKTNARMEELGTTGISYQRTDGTWTNASQWLTTENALRIENGYKRRIKY